MRKRSAKDFKSLGNRYQERKAPGKEESVDRLSEKGGLRGQNSGLSTKSEILWDEIISV